MFTKATRTETWIHFTSYLQISTLVIELLLPFRQSLCNRNNFYLIVISFYLHGRELIHVILGKCTVFKKLKNGVGRDREIKNYILINTKVFHVAVKENVKTLPGPSPFPPDNWWHHAAFQPLGGPRGLKLPCPLHSEAPTWIIPKL